MINNKLQFYQTRAGYDTLKTAGNIPDDALVFVKDTHEIITHGEEGFGGNVAQIDARVTNAINALDSTESKDADTDGLSLSITQTNGKITSINGSIAANTYDLYGSANEVQEAASIDATTKVNAAKEELIDNASADCNTLGKLENKISPLEIAVDALEATVGTGGNIDLRIATAKSDIIGDAQEDYNTLGKIEDKLQEEISRADITERTLDTSKANKADTLAGYGITNAYTKSQVDGLVTSPHQKYVTVATYSDLPDNGSNDTIYRVANYDGNQQQINNGVYSEYAWNDSQYILLCVKSSVNEVFDISTYNNNAKYINLADALAGNNVPESVRKGGMSIKFVQNSDDKYVQYILVSNSWSSDINYWEKINLENAVGDLVYYDGDVNYSSSDYNRILLNGVLLRLKSKNIIVKLTNTTGVNCILRLYSNGQIAWYKTSRGLFEHISNDTEFDKIMLYFDGGMTPVGHVKLECFTEPSAYYSIYKEQIDREKNCDNLKSKIDIKADIDSGVNLINPDNVQTNCYINPESGGIASTSNNYSVSGYIPVNKQNIISNCIVASYAASYNVYDEDFNLLRTISNDSNQYTYVNGDEYIRIGFDNGITNRYANYGNVLYQIPFTKYAHYDLLNNKIDSLQLNNVFNGTQNVYVDATEMNANSTYYEGIDKDSFIYKSAITTANTWCSSKVFLPNLSQAVHVKTKARLLYGTERSFTLWVSPSTTYDSQKTTSYQSFSFPSGINEIDIDFSFDPQYFIVYAGFDTDFSVWLLSKGNGDTSTKIRFDNFAIYQTVDKEEFNNFSGDNLSEVLHSLDESFPSNTDSEEDYDIKISPDGTKYVLQVTNTGDIVSIPVIPNKVHYFGNSLLSGNVFGMAASDQYHDYYYLINNYISSVNPNFVSDKHSCSDLERAITIEEARNQIQTLVGYLSGDEDLIFIQIGDNVSQQNLQTIFSTSFREFVLAVRNACQTARIIIMGCWYSSSSRIELLSQVAKETGCTFIDISDLNTIANLSYIGAILNRGYTSNWTCENVTNVVDNGEVKPGYPHNITVTFSVNGISYTTTVDCISYSLNETTLQYNSNYFIINNGGVASHPGDLGFKEITNRVLYKSKMVNTENYLD